MMGESRTGGRRLFIAGAGIPGLTLALALKGALGGAIDVVVCDPGLGAGAARHRGRAYAIAAGPRRMFERIGLWPRIEAAAQPIDDMVITDSRLADPVRPSYLTFERESEGEPFAHMVEAAPLVEALLGACREAGVTLVETRIAQARPAAGAITVRLADGSEQSGALVVAADGSRSALREAAGIGWVGRSYPQVGIVATIRHQRDHEGRAYEHFLPGGPFATLPLRARDGAHRSSIVWTEQASEAEALTGGGVGETLVEIERRFGARLGRLELEDGPSAHPLSVGIARAYRAERLALLGDAAHVIHPVAGQGLNLGLAGAAALAEAVTEAMRLGMDPGADPVLRAYERARRFETLAMAAATDGLNRLFSNDMLPVRLARDLGLGLVERMPRLKRAFIGRASTQDGPRLLRGEAL